jgi:hypothetical protein
MDAGPRRVAARLARKSVQSFHKRLELELAGFTSVGDAQCWATGPDHKGFYKEWRDSALGAGYGRSEDLSMPSLEDPALEEDVVPMEDSESTPASAYPLARYHSVPGDINSSGAVPESSTLGKRRTTDYRITNRYHYPVQCRGVDLAAQGALLVGVTQFGSIQSNGPLVQSLLADDGSDSLSQEMCGSGGTSPLGQEEAWARSASASSQGAKTGSGVSSLQNRLASGALELINKEDQWPRLTGLRTGIDRGETRQPWSIFNTEHNSRWETESMTYRIHDPPSEWLCEEDPGESGSLMTLAMAEGLAHLVYELKVSLEETSTNNYVYLARREMEFAIKSRTGAMVPLRLREALESLKDLPHLMVQATSRCQLQVVREGS